MWVWNKDNHVFKIYYSERSNSNEFIEDRSNFKLRSLENNKRNISLSKIRKLLSSFY